MSIVHDYIPLLFGLSDVQISMLCDDDGIGNVVLMLWSSDDGWDVTECGHQPGVRDTQSVWGMRA